MTKLEKRLAAMRNNPANVSFADLAGVCECYFGKPRQSGSSHHVYAMPWEGDPRVNIQNRNGMAKAYQVRQVIEAIDKFKRLDDANEKEGTP